LATHSQISERANTTTRAPVSFAIYQGLSPSVTRPQYRLRVDEIRVFYDVVGTHIEVLAIVAKSEAEQWLERFATKAE
jgi:hypothetical protein